MGQVFLLSTRAGGAGLNLVGANHLVLYDRWARTCRMIVMHVHVQDVAAGGRGGMKGPGGRGGDWRGCELGDWSRFRD